MDKESEAENEQQPKGAACSREPRWPLFLGSLVPALTVMLYFYLLWNVNFGSLIPRDIPNVEQVKRAVTFVLIWFGAVELFYCAIAYLLDFFAVWGFAKRHVCKTMVLTYSLRAWKLTGFLLSFAGFMFLTYSAQAWLVSAIAFWLGIGVSFLVAVFLGAAIVELVHKVHVSGKLFFTLMLTELVAFVATGYAASILFIVIPK